MGTEIYRVRPVADGRIRFEVECDDIAHFSRVANMIMGVVPAASAPVEPTAASYYAEAQARLRFAAEREAKREAAHSGRAYANSLDASRTAYFARVDAAEKATGQRIPRATVPPYDTTLGGQPLPGGCMQPDPNASTVLLCASDEPPLRNGEAYEAHELKVGGTD